MSEKTTPVYCSFQDALGHRFPGHPESPDRIQALHDWLDHPPYPEIQWLKGIPIEEGTITLVHHPSLLAFLQEESQKGPHEFEPSPSYVTTESYTAAMDAVSATLAIGRQIIEDGKGRGFAIVRPPGHHAEPKRAMGFCLMNNIAIAAADAVAGGLKKVAILDIDAHHGNGTEAAFWDTPEVGFLSTHESDLYPGSGRIDSAAHARGRIINVPLPAFSGTQAFREIIDRVFQPWFAMFKPEMLFVSAGYDTHFSDPLTTLTLDTTGYFELTKKLVNLASEYCHDRIMYVLEGGYDPVALKDNIQACLAGLCGRQDFPDNYGNGPNLRPGVDRLIGKLHNLHRLEEK